jgi:hypothetical protein
MTGTDLIVLAPWIAFAAGLAVICVLLLRSQRASRPPRPRWPPRFPGSAPGAQGAPADSEPDTRPDPQETRCQDKNAEARPQ